MDSAEYIDPTIDLFEEIKKLKKETDTVILAHYYQDDDIQDIADYIGDSLDLARRATEVTEKRILFAGVHFMAETAKILNPEKTVLVPDMEAGCSLAESCKPGPFSEFKKKYPDHMVISYINCSAEIKAMSDIIVTSSSAVKIMETLPKDQKVIFGPDQYLGKWVAKETGREMVLWNGSCIVHEQFSHRELIRLKINNPNAKVVAHPECPEHLLAEADFVGSTKKILDFISIDDSQEYIVVTEPGIIHQMKKNEPDKHFIPALGEDETCSCNTCPYMRLNTLEKIYLAMRDNKPQLEMDEEVRIKSARALQAMLDRA